MRTDTYNNYMPSANWNQDNFPIKICQIKGFAAVHSVAGSIQKSI